VPPAEEARGPRAPWESAAPYVVAVLVVFLAGGLTFLLPPVAQGTPFLFFFAAVTLSAWYGGLGPAVLTIILSAVWSNYFMLPPLHSLKIGAPADLLRLSLFLAVAFFISALQARQQRATAAERVQREYWQTTLESIGDAVIVTDARGNVTTMNPVAQRLTGWSLEAAQGKALADVFVIVNEGTHQPVESPVAKVVRTGAAAGLANHTVLHTKDGREIPIDDSAAPIRDAAGRLRGIVLVFRDIGERRRAEAALQRSHARLSAIMEGAHDAIFIKDRRGRYELINTAGANWLGKTVEEVIGHTDEELFTPESVPAIAAYDQRVMTTGEPQVYEYTGTMAGVTRTYHSAKVPYRDQSGNIAGVIGIARDISERMHMEEASLRLAAIVESTDDAIVSKSLDGIVTSWNAAAERIFGYTAQEMIGQSILRLLPEERRDEENMILERLRRGERIEHFETVRRTKDGRLLDVSVTISPLRDARGVVIGASKIARDVSAQKRAEQALRESEERYRALFESIDEGFCIIEKVEGEAGAPLDFRYVEANPAFAAQSGVGGVVGKTIRQSFPGESEEWLLTYDAVLRTGEPIRSERWLVTQGRVLDLYAFRVEDKTQPRVAVIFKDVTAQKQAEDTSAHLLAAVQRSNEELQQFAYIVSHDLNEPLRTMRSFTQLLERRVKGKLDTSADECMAFVAGAAQRMQQMLNDLLAYTRAGQTPEFQAVDCEALLARVLGELRLQIAECGATITHDSLPNVSGDATRLGQVFQNLVGNALKFRGAAPPRVHVTARRDGGQWRFAVRDNGIGIDPTQAGRLFQVFQRLHARGEYEGTGIGLAICRKIVEQHGGRIWVDSRPGEGATFYFTISEK
jgi:PAS domain S-box-containing protein